MAAPQQQMGLNDQMAMQAQSNQRGGPQHGQLSTFVYAQLSQPIPNLNSAGWQSQMQLAERHGKTMTL